MSLLGLALYGCEIIASPDRGTIPDGGGTGGSTDTGATNAGATAGEPSGGTNGQSFGGEVGAGATSGYGNTGGDPGAGASTSGTGGAGLGMGGAAGEASSAGAGAGGGPGVRTVRMIYVTSTPKKANFGGVSAADALCNASKPANAPTNATFKALLVDGVTRVACTSAHCATAGVDEGEDWVLEPGATYVRDDDTTVIGTTTAAGTFIFPLQASIGTQGLSYWTGLNANWTTSSDTCSSWTATSNVSASIGLDNTTDGQALAGAIDSCQTLAGNFFACVEQ